MDIIFSHGLCPDGFCAAYIAQKRYPEAKVIFLNHGLGDDYLTALVASCFNADILMLDYSFYTREWNDLFAATAKSFRILDHHKTAQAILESAPYAVFDMKRSGAGLAWDYLFGRDTEIANVPTLPNAIDCAYMSSAKQIMARPWYVDYVEDRDLWNWKLPNSREVCAYLGTLEFTKEAWDNLENMDEGAAAFKGEGALAHINHYVREVVKQVQTGFLQGYRTAVLNTSYLNRSEVGAELAKTHDVSLTWFERGDGMIQFSLCSIGDIDVSAIAKIFGGGGHKNAAGFQLELEKGRETIDTILGRDLARMKYIVQEVAKIERSSGGCA